MPLSALEQLKVEEWDRMIDINIKGILYRIAAVLPVMKAHKSEQIYLLNLALNLHILSCEIWNSLAN